ncbi:hypothetical protein HZS_975 [Henneguya salminicola]|nr:hypothetical protein HZS_975 [Henneguya salminicola]
MNNPFVLQLKVLGFKKWQTLDIFDHLQLLELIKWLGLNYFDHIIQDSNDETEQTFNHFFSSVGCPFEADDLISAVGWAITRSIHILYSRTNTIHKASDLSSGRNNFISITGDKKSIVKLLSLMGVSSCCDSTQNIITLEKSIEMFILNYQTQSGTKILDVNNVGTTHEFSGIFY